MFPEIVVVALPEETSVLDSDAVVAACSQAYLDGECQTAAPESTGAILVAEVNWLSETHADVTVKLVDGDHTRLARRELAFQPGDVSAERYRTLGFAAGSLAGTLAELERIQAQQDLEAAPLEDVHLEPKPTPPIAVLEPPKATPREHRQEFRDDYRFGLQLSSGIGAARMGLALGARAVWSERWLIEMQGGYAGQGSNADGIEATFVNTFVGVGLETRLGPVVLDTSVGPSVQWQQADRTALKKSASETSPGGEMALSARYAQTSVAPFIELRGGLYRVTDVGISADERRTFGPLQFQGILGVSFTRHDDP